MRFAAITRFKPTCALKKWGWDSGKGGNSINKLSACKAGHLSSLEILATSRVGAVALYSVLWTVVAKYRKWPFLAPCRTKIP
jgi:hypothetical protein